MTYKCEKCSKETGQLIWDFETKKWICNGCYNEKDEDRQKEKDVL